MNEGPEFLVPLYSCPNSLLNKIGQNHLQRFAKSGKTYDNKCFMDMENCRIRHTSDIGDVELVELEYEGKCVAAISEILYLLLKEILLLI